MLRINNHFLKKFYEKAEHSSRRRINHNFHKSYDDLVQRFLNVLKAGTYIRPHKHIKEEKFEVVIALKGKVLVVEFNDAGEVVEHVLLDAKNGSYAAELDPNTWHSMIALEDDSVLYEIKQGPFIEDTEKVFAPWAPEEGTEDVPQFIENLLQTVNIQIQ
jgi:cupin fold WbuC family metalloprotein